MENNNDYEYSNDDYEYSTYQIDTTTIDTTVNSTVSDIDLYSGITVDTYTLDPLCINGEITTTTFPGDIKFHNNNGTEISLAETLNKINERLAILEPDLEKMERYPALRKAYEHYKTIEAMIQDDNSESE